MANHIHSNNTSSLLLGNSLYQKEIKMFNIGITEEMIQNPRIKLKAFFKGDRLNWIVEVKQ